MTKKDILILLALFILSVVTSVLISDYRCKKKEQHTPILIPPLINVDSIITKSNIPIRKARRHIEVSRQDIPVINDSDSLLSSVNDILNR